MKHHARASLAALALSAMAMPAHAAIVWQGQAIIDTVTPACTSATGGRAIAVDDLFRMVLRPKNVSDNGTDTSAHFTDGVRLFHMTLPLGAKPSGTADTLGYDLNAVNKSGTTAYTLWVHVPATIDALDLTVQVKGKVPSFMFIAGCTVTFRASLVKRPD